MLQYPKLEHATLPSVSDWYKNTNILRDPPKSITTRRIDKVGQTTDINEMVDASNDRSSEAIRVYSRGINPMVSVSYDNNSNNAGNYGMGGFTTISSKSHASLPYKAMNNGAFRPPIRTQRDLLPLSRLPRTWFQTMSAPSFSDYSKSKYCPTKFRVIKDLLNTFDVKPNKSAKLEKPIIENFKMGDSINDKHINIEASAGIVSRDIKSYTRDNIDTYKGVNDQIIEAWANTNLCENRSQNLDGMSINQNNYIHDYLNCQVNSNTNENRLQNLENISFNSQRYIQNIPQFDVSSGTNTGFTFTGEMGQIEMERKFPTYSTVTSISDPRIYKSIIHENDIQLERNLPQVEGRAVVTKLEDFNSLNISSRDYKLVPKLKKESFENGGTIPKVLTNIPSIKDEKSDKDKIRSFVSEQQFERFN
jgi:hypothetical protein